MNDFSYRATWLLIYTTIFGLFVLILSGCALSRNQAEDDWQIKTTSTMEDGECKVSCEHEASRTQHDEGDSEKVTAPTK